MTLYRRGAIIRHHAEAVPLTEEKLAELREPPPSRSERRRPPDEITTLSTTQITHRVTELHDMVGQEELMEQIRTVCGGTKLRGTPMPHVLMTGPAGHGKTTLAAIIAKELDRPFISSTGMMLRKPMDLVNVLAKILEPSVLFIDEIHGASAPVLEVLYQVMEDGQLSVIVDGAAVTHELTDLTVVGATTKPGNLDEPFRQRFGFTGHVVAYDYDELATIVSKAWDRADIPYGELEPFEVARRCKGVPRRALHLAERVLDYCIMQGHTGVPDETVAEALASFGIDEDGLDHVDWRIIDALTGAFSGRAVGLDALASYLDMEAKTISEQHEPFLCQCELMARTRAGRIALPAAYQLVESA